MNRVIHPTFLTSDPGGHVVVGQSGLLPQRSEVDATRVQLVQDRTRRGFAPRRLLQHGDRDLVLRIGLGYHVALLRLEAVNVLGCQFERAPLGFPDSPLDQQPRHGRAVAAQALRYRHCGVSVFNVPLLCQLHLRRAREVYTTSVGYTQKVGDSPPPWCV